jgi:putative FmdB family regulatory protein
MVLFMPIFEYVCQDCGKRFEAILYGARQAECPACRGSKLEQQLSVFAVAASGKSDSAATGAGACGTCGDPRGPGACSMDDLD